MREWAGPSGLDRHAADGRDAGELWEGAFVLQVTADGRYAARDGIPVALPDPGALRDDDILLGAFGEVAWFARPVPAITVGEPTSWRDTAPAWYHPVAAAVALARWHATAPLCEACGSATRPELAGARRVCTRCGQLAFARQDPAVIVAVLDPDDRLLLGHQASWASGRVSILAGFVEPGESLEQACRREVLEEVGVVLDRLAYVGSQPWPMPRSLMTGFVAATRTLDLRPDMAEIVWARWFTREELRDAVATGEATLPQGASIARALIDAWLDGLLPRP